MQRYKKEIARVTLVEPESGDYLDLYFRLYDISITNKWIHNFKQLKSGPHSFREKNVFLRSYNRSLLDDINECIEKINNFYDRPLESINNLTEESLNYLHECYEIYGKRLNEHLEKRWWDSAYKKISVNDPEAMVWPGRSFNEDMHFSFIKLNELIHKSEFADERRSPGAIVLGSFNKRTDHILERDDYLTITPFLNFGDFCLGYNTLGKNLQHIILDNDEDAVARNAIVPQQTWSDEFYIHLKSDETKPDHLIGYKEMWDNLKIKGFQFGNFIANKEGYIKLGEMIPEQRAKLYKNDHTLIDFKKYTDLQDITLISTDEYKTGVRFPEFKKPYKKQGKEIVAVDTDNVVMITWILNNICTYSCRYCPPNLHNGKNYRYEWEDIEPFVSHLLKFYRGKNIEFNLSGGEPTLSPFFPMLVKKIYDSGAYVGITTNLARSTRFIKDNFKYLKFACCSFHPYYEFQDEKYKEFLEKIKECANHCHTTVRVMMDPLHWDQTVEFVETLKKLKCCKVEVVYIDNQYGSTHKQLIDISYTPAQIEYIKNFEPFQKFDAKWSKSELWSPMPTKGDVIFSDGSREELGTAQKYINNGQANFFNYSCDIGKNSLFIGPNGEVRKGNCLVGGKIGTVENWRGIDWNDLKQSIICNSLCCHCGADVVISKRKRNA